MISKATSAFECVHDPVVLDYIRLKWSEAHAAKEAEQLKKVISEAITGDEVRRGGGGIKRKRTTTKPEPEPSTTELLRGEGARLIRTMLRACVLAHR